MNKKQNVRLTLENKERLELVISYLNSDRYPYHETISINKAINFTIEIFYNLFVETDPNVTPKNFIYLMGNYQNIRDNQEGKLIRKLNKIDQLISEVKYIDMEFFKQIILSPEEKITAIESIYTPNTFENSFEKILLGIVSRDRNINFNLKNKTKR